MSKAAAGIKNCLAANSSVFHEFTYRAELTCTALKVKDSCTNSRRTAEDVINLISRRAQEMMPTELTALQLCQCSPAELVSVRRAQLHLHNACKHAGADCSSALSVTLPVRRAAHNTHGCTWVSSPEMVPGVWAQTDGGCSTSEP